MKTLPIQVKYLTSKSLFISVCLHLIIFNIFVFTISVRQGAHKPKFIFLGSILKRHDITGRTLEKKIPRTNLSLNDVTFKSKEMTKNYFEDIGVQKPAYVNTLAAQPKKTLKSTFEAPLPVEKSKEMVPEGIGLDIKIPPYRPLRLHKDDQN